MTHTKFVLSRSGQIIVFSAAESHIDMIRKFSIGARYAGFVSFPEDRGGQLEFFGESTSASLRSKGAEPPEVRQWYGVLLHEGTVSESIVLSNDEQLLTAAGLAPKKAAVVGLMDALGNQVWVPCLDKVKTVELARFSNSFGPHVYDDEVFLVEA